MINKNCNCGGRTKKIINDLGRTISGSKYDFTNVKLNECTNCGSWYISSKEAKLMDKIIKENPNQCKYQVMKFDLDKYRS
jgi:hypothetical protein